MELLATFLFVIAIYSLVDAWVSRNEMRAVHAHNLELARAVGELMVERNALLQDARRKEAA